MTKAISCFPTWLLQLLLFSALAMGCQSNSGGGGNDDDDVIVDDDDTTLDDDDSANDDDTVPGDDDDFCEGRDTTDEGAGLWCEALHRTYCFDLTYCQRVDLEVD